MLWVKLLATLGTTKKSFENECMKIREGIFLAGFDNVFLPVTKAKPKESLPILNKPLIKFIVEEAITVNINTLNFMRGQNDRIIGGCD